MTVEKWREALLERLKPIVAELRTEYRNVEVKRITEHSSLIGGGKKGLFHKAFKRCVPKLGDFVSIYYKMYVDHYPVFIAYEKDPLHEQEMKGIDEIESDVKKALDFMLIDRECGSWWCGTPEQNNIYHVKRKFESVDI